MAGVRSKSGGNMAPSCSKRFCGRAAVLPSSFVLILALAVTLGAAPVVAAPAWMQPQPVTLAPQSRLAPTLVDPAISVERAARIARRHTGGRVLSTSPVNRGNKAGVEVRLLINGTRVTKVFVDAQGEIQGR